MKLVKRIFIVLSGFLLWLVVPAVQAQQVALNTNAMMWGFLSPNIGCEVVTGERTSVDVSLMMHHKPYGIDSKVGVVMPEFRYWISGRPMVREFVGVGALASTYNFTWKSKVHKGDAFGVGLTFGYSFLINKRFNVQCFGSFGAVYFRHKHFFKSTGLDEGFDSNGRKAKANASGYKLMPVKIGVSLSYILK